jgi:hypothetical protein
MTALGIDIGGVDDIDPTLNFVSAGQSVAESVASQLLHDPGLLWWSPTIGYNLRQLLHMPFDEEKIQREVVRQAEFDERVKSASATASVNTKGDTITLVVNLTLVEEDATDIEFTLTVSEFEALLNVDQ